MAVCAAERELWRGCIGGGVYRGLEEGKVGGVDSGQGVGHGRLRGGEGALEGVPRRNFERQHARKQLARGLQGRGLGGGE
eukprot:1004282-Pyramimonas_sp.AAC.1